MKVTYRGTIDEAFETTFGLIRGKGGKMLPRHWEAGVPQEVTERDGWDIEETEVFELPSGEIRRLTKKRFLPLLEAARNNPSFDVEGQPPKKMEKRLRPAKFPNAAEESGEEIYIGPNT